MIDQFYTPPELASVLVGCLPKSFQPKVVADFAAGEGSLLTAAQSRWPMARKLANDVSPATVRWLKTSHPKWAVSNADFMSERSVRSSSLRVWIGRVDLVLLNPPFSQRSRKPLPVSYRGEVFGVSLAVAFLVRSLEFVESDGYLLAVLPDGCLVGKCDEKIWARLRQDFHIEVLRDNANSAFDGVRARTSLVRMAKARIKKHPSSKFVDSFAGENSLEFRRGQVQMHRFRVSKSPKALPLVHTTRLVHGETSLLGPRVVALNSVCGPALLFPRVGRVTPEKICTLEAGRSVVLSDCVIATQRGSDEQVIELRLNILSNWALFAEAYRGTGAPYLTLERATNVFRRIHALSAQAVGSDQSIEEDSVASRATALQIL